MPQKAPSSSGTPVERPLFWIGSALRDLKALPAAVQDDFGFALSAIQFGATPPAAKPWRGDGAGVFELVEDQGGDTFRAVYTVRFERAVYVLHVFQKKSPSGIRTSNPDRQLVSARLAQARAHYLAIFGENKR
ncbi:MAG: hypothetical protein RLY86_3051 [Pseudomonadota bacterium]|jgi:phage-related protein